MNTAIMEMQQAIKQQNEDLRDELSDLAKWEEEISRKEASDKKKTITETPTLPPIRGTAPTLKTAPAKPKEDPVQVAKNQGNEYFKLGNIDDAIRLYTKGIDMDPDTATTHVLYANRAMCYIKQEQWERAEKDASKCIQMNRGYSKAFFRRGLARKNLKKYKDARSDFETVLALTPGDPETEQELKAVTQLIRLEQSEQVQATSQRKKIVIAEVDDEDEETEKAEDPEETAARNLRIEKDMQQLENKRREEEERRRQNAAREEEELKKTRRTNNRVEIVEDEEEEAPKKVSTAAVKTPAAAPLPKSRNIKQEWTRETIKTPRNFTEFERVYKEIASNSELIDFLIDSVPVASYKSVFGVNLSPELLIDLLRSASRGSSTRAKDIIGGLSNLPRVGELAMFFDDKEKSVLSDAFKLVQSAGTPAAELQRIRKAFEM